VTEARLALFLPSLEPGGVQRVMVNLAEGILQRGLAVDLVLARATGPFLFQLPEGVRVIDLGAKRVLTSLPALAGYLSNEQPNALLAAQPHCNLVALWSKFLVPGPTRIFVSEHNSFSNDLLHTRRKSDLFFPILMRLFYPLASGIIAVSGGVAEDIAQVTRLERESMRVIYNPIVFPNLFLMANQPLNDPWFEDGEPPVILNVGRLFEQKDQATLLRAFALLRSRRPARMVILGEGEYRLYLQGLAMELGIHEDVAMPGFKANPFQYMTRSAAFVLSSAWEGFGNVLVEALACGTQVVSTDCESGPAEILAWGKFGRLVPTGDPISLAAAMESALDAPILPALLRERANDFCVDAIVPQYLGLLFPERTWE